MLKALTFVIGLSTLISSRRLARPSLIKMSLSTNKYPLVMDAFAIRQFNNPEYTGTQVNFDVTAFEGKVNEYFASGNYPLVDGYGMCPFCMYVYSTSSLSNIAFD